MEGASPVNDEVEVGFSEDFERCWNRVEQAGRLVMALFLLAAAAGLFGRGPYSHRTLGSTQGGLTVDYEPVLRYGTASQITIHVLHPGGRTLRLFLGSDLVESLGLQRALPPPVGTELRDDGSIYRYELESPDAAVVRLALQPSLAGIAHLVVRLDDSEEVRWSQLVLP